MKNKSVFFHKKDPKKLVNLVKKTITSHCITLESIKSIIKLSGELADMGVKAEDFNRYISKGFVVL